MPSDPIVSAAHIVQLALTPIFLLSAVASLLSVFTTRLGRVLDRVHQTTQLGGQHAVELRRLRLRSKILDAAVVFAAIAGGLTCCAAATLFFGQLRESATGTLLLGIFGTALLSSIIALSCFSAEIVLSGRRIREEIDIETGAAPPPSNEQ